MNWSFWTRTRPSALPQDGPDSCDRLDPLLALYADRMASPDEAQRVESHLPNCSDCREALQWMQATRRALALRPVALPPASLQSQIARAIAAAPAASARPARAFSLRPAYAAAASLAIAGTVLGGHFLLTSRSAAPLPVKPSQVASLPTPNIALPDLKHTVTSPPLVKHPSHPGTKPLPAPIERLAAVPDESAAPDQAAPRSVPPRLTPRSIPAPFVKRHPTPVKPLAPPRFSGTVMAKVPPKSLRRSHAAPLPAERKPDTVVAALPPAAVSIGPAAITPQETPPIKAASTDLLGSVREHIGQMRTVAYATTRKSIKEATFVAETGLSDKTPGIPITQGGWH